MRFHYLNPALNPSIGNNEFTTEYGFNVSSGSWDLSDDASGKTYYQKYDSQSQDGNTGAEQRHFTTTSAIGTLLYITVYSARNWDYVEKATGYETEILAGTSGGKKDALLSSEAIQPKRPVSTDPERNTDQWSNSSYDIEQTKEDWEPVLDKAWD